MSDADYSNRELDAKFAGLEDVMEAHFSALNEKVDAIVVQTTKTNGSVASLKLWRSYTIGFGACLMLLVVPALGWVSLQAIKNASNIAALSATVRLLTK